MKGKKAEIVSVEINGEIISAKECTRCSAVKLLTEYKRSAKGLGGRDSRCRDCFGRYYSENREKIRTRAKGYYSENREYIRSRSKSWYETNKPKALQSRRDYYLSNKEEAAMRQARWRAANPILHEAQRRRRRRYKSCLVNNLTAGDIGSIYARFNNSCALTRSDSPVLDHFVPLAWGHGGTHIGNVVPLDSRLNSSKGDANPFEWMKMSHISERVSPGAWDSLIQWLAVQNDMSIQDFTDYVYWCSENRRDLAELISQT